MSDARIDPRQCGAKADVWMFSNATLNVSAKSITLSDNNAGFQPSAASVNNNILVRDFVGSLPDIQAKITAWDGNQTITIDPGDADLTNYTIVTGLFGTDDSAAIQTALDSLVWPAPFLAGTNVTYGSIEVEGPNNPAFGGTDNGDLWYNGPRVVVFEALSRESSVFGIASPIRVGGGVILEFNTPIHALPSFPPGEPMLGCLRSPDNGSYNVVKAMIRSPHLIAMGLADYCMQLDSGYGIGIVGYGQYYGARLSGVVIGPLPNQGPGHTGGPGEVCTLSAGVISFTGTTRITNDRSVTRSGGTNDPTSVGFWWTQGSVDSAHTGDILVCGYRTGYRDQGVNNKVQFVHCWSVLEMGAMTISHDISGRGSFIGKAVVDSPTAPAGTSTCGVQFGAGGGNFIALIDSVFNAGVTANKQCTLVVNTDQVSIPNRIAMLHCATGSADTVYFEAVVSDPSEGSSLVIDQIIVDSNALQAGDPIGYTSLQSQLQTALGTSSILSASVATLEALTPGALWTPQKIASSVALWAEADGGVEVDSSGNVQSWTPYIGTLGTVPSGSTYFANASITASAPVYDSAGLDETHPAVVFNGAAETNQVLLFDNCIDSGNTDLSVFIVAKRLSAVSGGDPIDPRRWIGLPLNTATGYRVYGFFPAPSSDSGTDLVGFSGSGAVYATGWDVNKIALLELYATTTFIPDGAVGMGVTGDFTLANIRTTTAGGGISPLPSTGSPLLTGITIGGGVNKDGASIAISAIVIVKGTIITDTAQKIMGYLSNKWMTSTQYVLPPNSAYYLAPSANPLPEVTEYVGLANATVSNTTIPTTLIPANGIGSLTIQGNTLRIGKWFRLSAKGVYSTAASPGSLTFTLMGGATVIAMASLVPTGGLSDVAWSVEADIICRTIGASGSIVATGSAMGVGLSSGSSPVTVDTTSDLTLDLDVSWETASPSNTITVTQFTLEARNWAPDV